MALGRTRGVRCDAAGLGTLMNTRGLMELVILNIGLDLKIISPALFSMMVVMALVTTFMTVPLLERIFPKGTPCAAPLRVPLQRAPEMALASATSLPRVRIRDWSLTRW